MEERPEFTESDIQLIAASFNYPKTPDIASGVRQRLARDDGRRQPIQVSRWAWAFVAGSHICSHFDGCAPGARSCFPHF